MLIFISALHGADSDIKLSSPPEGDGVRRDQQIRLEVPSSYVE